MILHFPFVAAGLRFKEGENKTQAMITCAHHELVASALVTKLAHEINPRKYGRLYACCGFLLS